MGRAMVGLGTLDFVGDGTDGEASSGVVVREGGEGTEAGDGVGSSKSGKVPVSSGSFA